MCRHARTFPSNSDGAKEFVVETDEHCSPHHHTHCEPSFLGLNGIIWRGEHYPSVSVAWHPMPWRALSISLG